MGSRNRYDGVNEYAVKLIKWTARKLIGHYGFTKWDQEDIEQELVLEVIIKLPKYKSERAHLRTFTDRVVNHKVADMVESRKAGKRDYRRCTCSLNDELANGDGDLTERVETFDQDDYLIRTGRQSRPTSELLDLHVDVNRAIDKLSCDERGLCQLLMTRSITEISRDTGIPRGTIYDRIGKISAVFQAAGLADYFA